MKNYASGRPFRWGAALVLITSLYVRSADQPQFGAAWTRNMVSRETNLPERFDPAQQIQFKWKARLGSEAHSTPVVASGRVLIGTNNNEPRDPKHDGDRGVLMCFDEKNGSFLWQLVVPKRDEDIFFDWPNSGMSSPATVEGDRVYMLSNRGEVMCLDLHGQVNGNDGPYQEEGRHMAVAGQEPLPVTATDADILWVFDLVESAGIWPHDAAHSSILVDGPFLYLNTGNGVDNTHKKIRRPGAPSLVVLEKSTGRWIARDDEQIGPRIFHSTWSSPALAEVQGRKLVIFAGGDGVIYSFTALPDAATNATEVLSLQRVWRFDPDPTAPKDDVHRYNGNRREGPSNVKSMPVFHNNRVYVTAGGDLWWGKNEAWLHCFDATGSGDITVSGKLWSHPLQRHSMSTPAIQGQLAFVADCGRTLHCLDATTGKVHWTHEAKGEFWASPFVADGKVYIGTRRGDFWIFAADSSKQLLHTVQLDSPISATPIAANGVLYVATMNYLYAFQK